MAIIDIMAHIITAFQNDILFFYLMLILEIWVISLGSLLARRVWTEWDILRTLH